MRFLPVLGVAVVLVAGASATVRRAAPVAVAFWDARHGLLALTTFAPCGRRGSGERIQIARTADGGRSWTRVLAACATESITIAGPQIALVPVPGGGLLKTSDGGGSWSRVPGQAVGS